MFIYAFEWKIFISFKWGLKKEKEKELLRKFKPLENKYIDEFNNQNGFFLTTIETF